LVLVWLSGQELGSVEQQWPLVLVWLSGLELQSVEQQSPEVPSPRMHRTPP
jgi:hypothetical protein